MQLSGTRFHIHDFTYLGLKKFESNNQVEFRESKLLVHNDIQRDSLTQNSMVVRKDFLRVCFTVVRIMQIFCINRLRVLKDMLRMHMVIWNLFCLRNQG